MQRAGIGQVFDGNKLFAMNHGQKYKATVNAFVRKFSLMILSNNNCASTTIAFGTSLLHSLVEG
jgi:hypothetical protein